MVGKARSTDQAFAAGRTETLPVAAFANADHGLMRNHRALSKKRMFSGSFTGREVFVVFFVAEKESSH